MTRTPRQRQGQDLKPVTVLLPPVLRAWLETLAASEKRSLSYLIRDILEAAHRKAGP